MGGIRAIPARASEGPSFFRRHIICRFGWCMTFKQAENDTHVWGECTLCCKKAGEISREALRRYLDAEEYHRAFLASRAGGSGQNRADATPKSPTPEE